MPKKSASARSGAQRKPKAQKSIELVRPASVLDEQPAELEGSESTEQPIATPVKAKTAATIVEERPAEQEKTVSTTAPKGSAAARLAARRQATQRAHQRNAATLITPEHFSYVRRDLVTIAILAVIMITIILVSYYFIVVRA